MSLISLDDEHSSKGFRLSIPEKIITADASSVGPFFCLKFSKQKTISKDDLKLAGVLGFEPSLKVLETLVLAIDTTPPYKIIPPKDWVGII